MVIQVLHPDEVEVLLVSGVGINVGDPTYAISDSSEHPNLGQVAARLRQNYVQWHGSIVGNNTNW